MNPADFTALRADSFGPSPMRTAAGHCRSYEETWAWLAPLLPLVPVTRVYDATPLDVLGLPIWSSVTPLAKDLTVHAGKGVTPLASRLSAAMEAVERVCAETLPEQRVWLTAYPKNCVDPQGFGLPFESAYQPQMQISWTGAYDLMSGTHRWVPVDLVVSPGRGEICSGTETNGLASGNTYTEATLHALYELIERDAMAHEEFFHLHHDLNKPRPVRLIEHATLPDESRMWTDRLLGHGLRVQVQVLTTEHDIPVFEVTLVDEAYPGMEDDVLSFVGYGCDLDPSRAVLRAITEAAQAHTGVILGARDEFEGMRELPERPAMLQRRIDKLYGDGHLSFPDTSWKSGDAYDDLQEVLRRLNSEHCLVTELTRPDLGVPVVRVLVPGLAAPYPDSSRRPSTRLLATVI